MACNTEGHYSPAVQHAARTFLANGGWVARARDAVRRRGSNPHSASVGGRAYDYQDLQSMYQYLQQHPDEGYGYERQHQPQQQPQQQLQYGDFGGPAVATHVLLGQMLETIQHLIHTMEGLGRQHMSLQRLMAMGEHGHSAAQQLLHEPVLLSNIIDNMVKRNVAINIARLQGMGMAIDGQGSIPGAHWNGGSPGFAGPSMPGVPAFSPSPAAGPGISRPDAGVVNQDAIQSQRLQQDLLRRQAVHKDQEAHDLLQSAAIREDSRRQADIEAAQRRADELKQQQQREDDEAARQRRADDQQHADRH